MQRRRPITLNWKNKFLNAAAKYRFYMSTYTGVRDYLTNMNRIGCVMVSVLAQSVVDRGFEPRSGQTKDYAIGVCCFSAKHATLRRKSKDWLLGIRIMCPSGTTCLPTDCGFSGLAL